MPERATDTHAGTSSGSRLGAPSSHYAPGRDRPLGSYAILTGAYTAGLAGGLIALRAHRH